MVYRHNVNDSAAIGSHGYDTSAFGNRTFEIYDNRFLFANIDGTGNSFNIDHHIRERGGTGVITDNYFENINSTSWGDKPEIHFRSMVSGQMDTIALCLRRRRWLRESWIPGTAAIWLWLRHWDWR